MTTIFDNRTGFTLNEAAAELKGESCYLKTVY